MDDRDDTTLATAPDGPTHRLSQKPDQSVVYVRAARQARTFVRLPIIWAQRSPLNRSRASSRRRARQKVSSHALVEDLRRRQPGVF